MTKSEALKLFNENYGQLTDSERELFSRITLKLLHETYLVREKESDKKDYSKAKDMVTVLRAYFAFMNFILNVDDDKGVIFIRTELDSNRIHLKKMESVLLLVLRSIFYDENEKVSVSDAITTTISHLVMEVSKTDIYPNFNSATVEFRNSLVALRRYKAIDFDEDISHGTTVIRIYKSLLLIVDIDSMDTLNRKLVDYKGGGDDETDPQTETD